LNLNIPPLRSLKTRVTVLTLIIFLVSLWSVTYFAQRSLREDMQRLLSDQQQSTAAFAAKSVNDEMSDRVQALEILAARISTSMMKDPARLQAMLEDRKVDFSLFNNGIAAAGIDGTVIAEYPPLPGRLGANFAERDYMAGPLKQGKMTIGRPVMSKLMHAPAFVIGMPILDPQGAVIGVLGGVTNLRLPNFLDNITQGHWGRTGVLLLASRQHRVVITASDKTRIMESFPPRGVAPIIDARADGKEDSTVLVDPRGVEVLSAAMSVPVANWFIAVSMPTEEAFAPIRDLERRLALAAAFATLLTGVLTWWVLKRQLAPMTTAAKLLTVLPGPDQQARPLPIARPDEVGQLIAGFNHLVSELGQRDAFLKLVLNNSSAAIFLIGSNGRITQANQRMAEIFGYPVETLTGLEYLKLVPPSQRELRGQQMAARLAGNAQSLDRDLLFSRADGSEFWGHVTSRRFYDVKGEENGLIGTILDITERKQAESVLKTSEEKYRALIETTNTGYLIVDRQAKVLDANSEYVRLSGYNDLREILGRSVLEWTAQYEIERTDKAIAQCAIDGFIRNLVIDYVDRKGRTTPIEINATVIGEGAQAQILCLCRDITERKLAERNLVANQERLQLALSGGELGFWDWDIASGEVLYSEHWFSLLGLAMGESRLDLDNWIRLIHPDDLASVNAALESHLKGQTPTYECEHRVRHQDGRWLWLLARGRVVEWDKAGAPFRTVGTYSEITHRKQATLELASSKHRYQGILQNMMDAYWRVNETGRIVEVNQAICQMHGYSKDELLQMSISDFEVIESAQDTRKRIETVMRDGRDIFESQHRCRDGRIIDVEISASMASDAPGHVDAFHRDVTGRKAAQAELQLAANVFGHAREGIIITDASGTIIDVNESFARITGFGREEALGQNPRILKSDRQDQAFYELLWRDLTEQGHWSGEIWNRHRDGEVYAELLTISAVRDASGAVQQYVGLFSDISAIKEHQIQLEHIAHFDALTHLPNRVLLADRLQQAMAQSQRRGQQLAVAFLDLDGFKTINDQHGHDAGDQVLVKLAQRMKQALREGDSLARLGGDEFVAVLIDLEDLASSRPLLSRLLEACSQPVRVGDLSLQVSASLGVTFYPQPQDIDADQLLRQADQAMYQAKLSGKNRFHFFDAEQDSSIRGHHESVERIRLALDNQEFVLHYQPKVNMGSGQIIGAEALIRWQHPEKGLLAPAVFLPVIEDHPLAVSIGEWVIDTALTHMEIWQAAGLDFGVSVNIGARQLQQSDFVDRLKFILAKHPQVNPASLELEVLETSALEDIAQVSQVIEDCGQIGVTCALDDFGTGYSSLTYLKRLRVAMLKIDQSFVRDMLEDPDDLAILQGIIGLAASFKRHVIAEGVETVAHGSLLMQLGCELGQGYGIARPMPAAQMPQWATEWQPDVVWSELPWLGGVPESLEEQSVF
jgi:diguanylate cyclase (GGDEF)-like protein/PAS domain S-box-containing protein